MAVAIDDIYGATSGKYCSPLALMSNSIYSSSIPACHDAMPVYHHRHIVDNNNGGSMDRDYATTLQIRQTVPPLAASFGQLWTCPVHGRVLSVVPQRASRGSNRLYEVAARLDTVREDVTPNGDLDVSARSADDRDVMLPFYHELEPTAADLTPCHY